MGYIGRITQSLLILFIHNCGFSAKGYSQHYMREGPGPAPDGPPAELPSSEIAPGGNRDPFQPKTNTPIDLMEHVKNLVGSKEMNQAKVNNPNFFKKKFIILESLYEPYWRSGEWVFSRTTFKLYKRKATRAPLTTRGNYTSPASTKSGQTITTTPTPYLNLECQHPCPFVFEDYGLVCGQRYNGLGYEMKQFDDVCDLYAANCIDPDKEKALFLKLKAEIPKRDGQRRGEWRVLYRGPCWELTTSFIYAPTEVKSILSRARYMNRVIQEAKSTLFR